MAQTEHLPIRGRSSAGPCFLGAHLARRLDRAATSRPIFVTDPTEVRMPTHPISRRRRLAILATLICAVSLAPRAATAWEVRFGTTPDFDAVLATHVLPGGDVVIGVLTEYDGYNGKASVRRLAGATGALVWQREVGGWSSTSIGGNLFESPRIYRTPDMALAVDGAGNVVVGFGGPRPPSDPDQQQGPFTVVKVDGTTGAELWRFTAPTSASVDNAAFAVTIAPNDDVFAGGVVSTSPPGSGRQAIVVRLAAATGAQVWRHTVNQVLYESYVLSLAVDPSGDLLVGGNFDNCAVRKLSGATGNLLWTSSGVSFRASEVLVLSGGDVVAAGAERTNDGARFRVARFASANGSQVWQQTIGSYNDAALAAAVDAAGDVVVGGLTGAGLGCGGCSMMTIGKLAGASGAILWQRDLRGKVTPDNPGPLTDRYLSPLFAFNVAVDVGVHPARVCSGDGSTTCTQDAPDCNGNGVCLGGDPIVFGWVSNPRTANDLQVTRLASSDGHEVWRRQIDGARDGKIGRPDAPDALAIAPSGDVVAGGYVNEGDGGGIDAIVTRLDGATGCSTNPSVSPTQDSDGDGVVDICDNCPGLQITDTSDADFDGKGDLCDPCPADYTDRCRATQTTAGVVGAGGGSVATADFSVTIDVPPGLFPEGTPLSVTGGLPESDFKVEGQGEAVLLARLEPDGLVFPQPVTVTFSWADADEDGIVDGTTVPESDLQIWRDGVAYTATCESVIHQPGTCTVACCDRDANSWVLQVDHFSEYATADSLGKCQRAVASETAKLLQVEAKAIGKCELKKLAGRGATLQPPNADCRVEGKTTVTIDKARRTMAEKIGKACGGVDKECGGDITREAGRVALGWSDACPNLGSSPAAACRAPLDDCGSIASCGTCMNESAVTRTVDDLFARFVASTPKSAVNKCQTAIGSAAQTFAAKASKILDTCWSARLKGKHRDLCPNPSAPPGSAPQKAAADLAAARARYEAGVCAACGGGDGACDGANDLPPASVTSLGSCPNVVVPGGASCGGAIASMADLAACVQCLGEHGAVCADRAHVPQFVAYPAECNPCVPTEFACGSGECLDLSLHCNGSAQCGDGSDEVGCP